MTTLLQMTTILYMEKKADPTSIRLTITSDQNVRKWAFETGVSLSDMIEILVRAEEKRRKRRKQEK